MLRDTSAASTRRRSTSSPARAAAGCRASPVKINVRRILTIRIAAPHRASSRKTAKTRRCREYSMMPKRGHRFHAVCDGLIGDEAVWRECDLDQGAGVGRALDAEIGAVGFGERLGQ